MYVDQHLPGAGWHLESGPSPTYQVYSYFRPSPVMSHRDQLWQEAGGILPVLPSRECKLFTLSPEILRNHSEAYVTEGAFSPPLV